jgi:hypothetical protein
MLSDNKGIETIFRRWCNELPYYVDNSFAGDDVFNSFPKLWSLFEPVIDYRFAYRFVYTSPTVSVPIWEPEFLRGISNKTLW